MKRMDMKALLADPAQRRAMMVPLIVAVQAREGITTTTQQAEQAYDKVAFKRSRCSPSGSPGDSGI